MSGRVRDLLLTGPASADGSDTVLQRVRWRFVLLILAVSALAPLGLPRMDGISTAAMVVYLAGVGSLATWAVVLYRTAGRFRVVDVASPLLIVVIGTAAGDPVWVFGPTYLALFLHAFYGSRRRVLGNAALYLVAFQGLVAADQGIGAAVGSLLSSSTLGIVIVAWVMSEMADSLRRTDAAQERERTLTATGRRLLRADDPEQVASIVAAGAAQLAAVADGQPRVAVWWQTGDGLQLATTNGPTIGIDRFDLTVLPAEAAADYLRGQPLRLDPAQMASASRRVGLAHVLDHGLAVPLTDRDRSLGMVFVQTTTRLDDDVLASMQGLAREASLAEQAVRRSQLLTGVVENSADGIAMVDTDERLTFASPAVVELVGRPVAVGEPVTGLLTVRSGEDMRTITSLNEIGHGSTLGLQRADGTLLEVEVSTRPIAGEGTVLNIRDVSEQRRMQAEITYRAFYDPVTELPNRALFLDRLGHALARTDRDGSRVAVALFDLDDFKLVNDRMGHLAGDRLLRHVATQVTGQIRDSDTLARLGGDEFALLFEGLDHEAEQPDRLEQVLAAVRCPVDLDGHEVAVTASAGVTFADRSATAEQVLVAADLAMYAAKDQRKGTAVVYHPDLRIAIDEQRDLRDQLEAGIADGELRLRYQPILSLGQDTAVGVEALVRWEHPTRGLIAPDRFIPLAEDTGLILPLGRWVLTTACRDLSRWRAAGMVDERFQVHINLSVRQLADEALVTDVEAALDRFGVAASSLVIEVTETALADNPEVAESTLRRLHRLGVAVAIDDFGTGYASFTYLRRFPVDIVKIDRSFVTDVAAGPESAALARAIVRLASSLEMTTVAEGVETDEVRGLLAGWGCEQAQGWLWAPALAADEVVPWLPASTPAPAAAAGLA